MMLRVDLAPNHPRKRDGRVIESIVSNYRNITSYFWIAKICVITITYRSPNCNLLSYVSCHVTLRTTDLQHETGP